MSVTEKLGGPAARGPLPGTRGPGRLREVAPRYALLPLRILLGLTFLYAGLDTFSDAGPLGENMSPDVMERMIRATEPEATAGWLSALALDHSGTVTHGVGAAEIVVGAGVLLGALTRVAAAGGAVLALSFWLTVGSATDPSYLGPGLPYLLCFVTLLLTGSGPWAVDRTVNYRILLPPRNRPLFR
ncbi:DoxX family membrane protein [Streptomyces sp. DSM 44917]|uniref:DoxX family membrane protein n=1 Tax=Streptomyces boetiae TaxID=3075541 RepID=A0ABU2LAB9_9ACTN|nr:DoxX family membrane protein [Streptomyces sp. DSM 44917]MDT0308515.1 DoxX family membrane protein [Streptomyces sp. DSM 44917]